MSWIPPRSPHNLIQEALWHDEWRVLVSCLLLNLTTRKQVDGVIDRLFGRYPGPVSMTSADDSELYDIVKTLGLANKRVKTLKRFSEEFLNKEWVTAKDLYGCGKYADDAWRIFCKGEWESVEPNDHALNNYHDFLKQELGEKSA